MTDWLDTPLRQLMSESPQPLRTALRYVKEHFQMFDPDIEPTPQTVIQLREHGLINVPGVGTGRTRLIKELLASHEVKLRADNEALPYATPFLQAAAVAFISAERARPVAIGLARGRKASDVKLGEVLALDPTRVLNIGLKPSHFKTMGRVAGELQRSGFRAEHSIAYAAPERAQSVDDLAAMARSLINGIDKVVIADRLSPHLTTALFELREAADNAAKIIGKDLDSQSRVQAFGWD